MPHSSRHAEIWVTCRQRERERDESQLFAPETNAIVLEYKLDRATREEGGYFKKKITVYELNLPKMFRVKYMGLFNKNRPNGLDMLYLGQL
jgi:hypothetical protein